MLPPNDETDYAIISINVITGCYVETVAEVFCDVILCTGSHCLTSFCNTVIISVIILFCAIIIFSFLVDLIAAEYVISISTDVILVLPAACF